jgi:hypothetical protein
MNLWVAFNEQQTKAHQGICYACYCQLITSAQTHHIFILHTLRFPSTEMPKEYLLLFITEMPRHGIDAMVF